MTKKKLFWTISISGFLLLVLTLSIISPVDGQPVFPAQPGIDQVFPPGPDDPASKEPSTSAHEGAIKLHEETKFSDFLEVARDCIKDELWGDACRALQAILENEEDFYVRVIDRDFQTGIEIDRWTSVKYEANKLVGTMPLAGMKKYEEFFGRVAEIELDRAKKSGEVAKLAQVAQKYFHTRAGTQANDVLATYFLDRGQFFQAALQFDRMLTLGSPQADIQPMTLFKATIAYRRTGDTERAEQIWKQLLPELQATGGLQIGKQMVGIDQLKKILENTPRPQTLDPRDWALVRGNLTNTAQTIGSPPLLGELQWKRPTLRDWNEVRNEFEPDGGGLLPGFLTEAVADIRSIPGMPIMPGFFPIAVEGKLLYRTYSGVAAVHLQDFTDDEGNVTKAGGLAWVDAGIEGGLARSLTPDPLRSELIKWRGTFKGSHRDFMNFIYENTLVGTLSADLKNVYVIDDMAFPIPPNEYNKFFGGVNPGINIPTPNKEVRDRITQNSLQAYSIKTGSLLWRLGQGDTQKIGDFDESHFLGPPLPVAGKLYVLNEKANGDLRLIGIEPPAEPLKPPVIASVQKLGTVEDHSRFVRDPNRRVHAVHLAYGEGILICPTNCGQVLGIDLLSKSLAWAYPYREGKRQTIQQPIGPGGFNPGYSPIPFTPATWKVAPPAIDSGKVVFTAPDAQSLHCVNLRDGIMVWKKQKSDSDLFLAGVWNGKVVVVGRNSCYALDINNRNLLWEVMLSDPSTGAMPSGQGVASKNIYYLPLSTGEIVAIDIEKGIIRARNRPTSDNAPTPGNLIFHDGLVVSQTLDEVVVYPQLTAKLEVVEAEYKKNPNDLQKMLYLSELRLASGQIHDAIKLMYQVKAKNPPEEIKNKLQQKLYEGLSDLFQVDFKTAKATYLDDYQELLKLGDDTEQQHRQANFYRLYGSGLEEEGDLVGAFLAYRKFGSLPLFQKEGIPAREDPLRKVPAQVWFRGRMASMFAIAKEQQKKPLEEEIWKEWQKVSKARNLDEIRSFVAMFDASFKVGQEARLQLANAIIDRAHEEHYLEAELSLEQLRSGVLADFPNPGGQALEALARLEIKKQSIKLAANYYRRLAELFPNTVIRDGKTGRDLFEELAANKLFLPYLEPPGVAWGNGKFKFRSFDQVSEFREKTGVTQTPTPSGVMLIPRGDLSPNASQLRLILEPYTSRLRLTDLASGRDLWDSGNLDSNVNSWVMQKVSVPSGSNTSKLPDHTYLRNAHTRGNLAVVQVGTMAYAIDLSKPDILWRESLLNTPMLSNFVQPQSNAQVDSHGHLLMTLKMNNPTRIITARVGYVAAVEASYVALVKQDQLVVIDPLSDKKPRVLWSRSNIDENTHVFGDDQNIYLVDVVNGIARNGRAIRASDGTPVNIPDFAAVYQKRLHINGNRILSAHNDNKKLVLRSYDLPTGKDLWKGTYHPDTAVLKTVDPFLTGVIEPNGKMTVVDLKTQTVLMQTSVLHGRVTREELRNLEEPLLLADRDYFYVALNKPIDPQVVSGGQLILNFTSGLRCETVNGWFGAFHRKDNSRKVNGKIKSWKKGDLHWYSSEPVAHQKVVVENFEQLPLVMFSVLYHEKKQGPGFGTSQWISKTQSIDKNTGKWVHYPFTPRLVNGASPTFHLVTVDARNLAINMIGLKAVYQHYIDDGRLQQVSNLDDRPAPAVPEPVGKALPLPPEMALKVAKMALEFEARAKLLGGAALQEIKVHLPNHHEPITIRTGNPTMIVVPGQQPIPLQDWLNQVKVKQSGPTEW